jgi:cyanate permease
MIVGDVLIPYMIQHAFSHLTAYRMLLYSIVMERKSVGYRLSTTALRLLCALTETLGLSKTSVIEMAIRELAKRKGIK